MQSGAAIRCSALSARLNEETLRKFYYVHNARRMDLVEKRIASIAQMTPLTGDLAILEPAIPSITMLARQLLALRTAIAALEKRIAELSAAHPDRALLDSLPGAG
jgi:hypothetical protein